MKALLQRVTKGSVTIDGQTVGSINTGLVVLLGVRHGDTPADSATLAAKTLKLRIFPDDRDRMHHSVTDIDGSILVISQFTLYADTRKGLRPGFNDAAEPTLATECYEAYIRALRTEIGAERVQTGQFGADMSVEIINDGPVTIELTTDAI